jgi:hypothetical protein
MMPSDDRDDDASEIHRVDTVPPPADGDAYSAPTKVGPVTNEAWKELIRQANEEGNRNEEAAAASQRSPSSAKAPFSSRQPISGSKPISSRAPHSSPAPSSSPSGPQARSTASEEIPRVYAEDDDEEAAATLLHHRAKGMNDSELGGAPVSSNAPVSSGPTSSGPVSSGPVSGRVPPSFGASVDAHRRASEPPSWPFGPPAMTAAPEEEPGELPVRALAALGVALMAIALVVWLALR